MPIKLDRKNEVTVAQLNASPTFNCKHQQMTTDCSVLVLMFLPIDGSLLVLLILDIVL